MDISNPCPLASLGRMSSNMFDQNMLQHKLHCKGEFGLYVNLCVSFIEY